MNLSWRIDLKKGTDSLRAEAAASAKGESNHLDEEGCRCRCCKKLRWVTERAIHYAEILGTTAEAVLEAWETSRDYWFMNFYQEANQPLIEGENVKVFDTPEQFRESITKEFRCPKCAGVSTDAQECSRTDCDWKAYGLFGTLGKGVTVLTKNPIRKAHIFMPVAWENPRTDRAGATA